MGGKEAGPIQRKHERKKTRINSNLKLLFIDFCSFSIEISQINNKAPPPPVMIDGGGGCVCARMLMRKLVK